MSENDRELKTYVESLMDSGQIEELVDQSGIMERLEGPVGSSQGSNSEFKRAQKAIEKLAIGKALTPNDQYMIEAIIIPDKRPAALVQDNDFAISNQQWLHYKSNPTIEGNLLKAIPAVGRIEMPNHHGIPYAGTGFLVGDNIIMTNRHVAELFIRGVGEKGLSFAPGQVADIDYREEEGGQSSATMKITKPLMIHPYWDMALLEVEGMPDNVEPLTLSMTEPEDLEGREIALVGYPAFDPRGDAATQNRVFNNIFNVKRLQPGLLKGRRRIGGYFEPVNSVTHDASTLGGNSGSAVIDVKTGDVVALHFAGRRRIANYAVPTYELSRDEKVVNTGIEFGEDSTSNYEDPNPFQSAWSQADMVEQVAPQPPVDGGQGGGSVISAPSPGTGATGGGSASRWTIPITIDINVGSASIAGSVQPDATALAAPAIVEKMVEPMHDEDYSHRPGYDASFIGLDVPMPKVSDLDRVSKLDDGGHVLDYYHFSLIMDKKRRLPIVTAANVDTRKEALRPEPDRKYNRKALNGFTSKNDREKWFLDPRIPGAHQLPDKFFTKDRTAFDKGHVVRRNAVVWGASYEEVQFANGDTFHVTNCTPQVKGFNRSRENGDWGKLENMIFKQAKSEKLCVLAGPVLHEDDPVFHGVDQFGSTQVRIPRAYWKVIAANAGGKLQTFAFQLEQDLSDVAFEFQVGSEWKSKQVKLKDLEKALAGVTFDKKLLHADQG